MGEKRTFLQATLAQTGIVLALPDLPVMTEQSLVRWSSIRTLGSWPGRTATGVLQSGPGEVSERNCQRGGAHTIWSDPIVPALIILGTAVCRDHEMFLTEGVLAVLAFEREKVHEETGWMGALPAN